MKLKMKKTMPGSPDGITVNLYKKDEIYDIPESLATVFLDNDLAEKASITAKIVEPEKPKSVSSSPENKMEDEKTKDKKDK
jgi:hypothetical protein